MADKARKERREKECVGIGGILTQNRADLIKICRRSVLLCVLCGFFSASFAVKGLTSPNRSEILDRKGRKECRDQSTSFYPIAIFFCISSSDRPLVSG